MTRELSARSFEARATDARKRFAPHFVREVLETHFPGQSAAARQQSQIRSTLDLEKQSCIEKRVADYIERNRPNGIENAAVLLVDSRQMDVLAQVGSADFSNVQIHGQVDGTRKPPIARFDSETFSLRTGDGARPDSSAVGGGRFAS